jgi:predicted dienelactone hydrolase
MFAKRLVFVLLIVVLALPAVAVIPFAGAQENASTTTFAAPGPYPVGTMEFEAETPLHTTTVKVWYPAVYPEGRAARPGIPLKEAEPDPSGGPYPLVVHVPGWTDDRISAGWLADHLASYGFVAMAMDPLDVVAGGGYEPDPALLLIRPQELVWQIDYAESLTAAGGGLEGMIDMDSIAVTGHSYGGYTALMAAGARIDWDYYDAWCLENHDTPLSYSAYLGLDFCEMLAHDQTVIAPLAGLDAAQPGLWPSWGDSRVDVIVSMAPVFWMILGPEGMANVSLPMLLMGGAKDPAALPADWDLFYENASSAEKALVIFEDGDHIVFSAKPSYSRHFITAFLLATLTGDQDAAAALAPDAVSFPGITYKAQGF